MTDLFAPRPLPLTSLKQRTSSVDCRKDFTQQTWMSLLGLLKPREFFITVDHFSIWRRHLAWSKQDGNELRTYMTQRFASNMVFMSLLLGAELGVLFNSSQITTKMREDMRNQEHGKMEFWIGIVIIISVVLTIFTLMSTFTAWGMVSSISDSNSHCILRSSMGQYAAHLPANLIVAAIYSFLLWVVMFLFILLPDYWALLLLVAVVALFLHIVITFSALGRLIMHSGAMGTERIFDPDFEQDLLPHGLHTSLLVEATENLRTNKSITRQYRAKPSMYDDRMTSDCDRSFESVDQTPVFSNSSWTRLSPFSSPCVPSSSRKGGAMPPPPPRGRMQQRKSDSSSSYDCWVNNERSQSLSGADSDANDGKHKRVSVSTSGNRLPRPSLLNAANHRQMSIKRLTSQTAQDLDDSSPETSPVKGKGDEVEESCEQGKHPQLEIPQAVDPQVENPQKVENAQVENPQKMENPREQFRRTRKVSWSETHMESFAKKDPSSQPPKTSPSALRGSGAGPLPPRHRKTPSDGARVSIRLSSSEKVNGDNDLERGGMDNSPERGGMDNSPERGGMETIAYSPKTIDCSPKRDLSDEDLEQLLEGSSTMTDSFSDDDEPDGLRRVGDERQHLLSGPGVPRATYSTNVELPQQQQAFDRNWGNSGVARPPAISSDRSQGRGGLARPPKRPLNQMPPKPSDIGKGMARPQFIHDKGRSSGINQNTSILSNADAVEATYKTGNENGWQNMRSEPKI